MVVAPDGSWLATGSDTEVRVWAADDWTMRSRVPGSWKLLAVKPDSSRLVIDMGDVRINVELPTGDESVDDSPHDESLKTLIRAWGDYMRVFTPTSPPLTTNGWVSTPEGNWRVSKSSFGEPITLEAEDGTTRTLAGHRGPVAAIAPVARSGWLAGCLDGTVRLWAEDGSPLCVLEGHAGTVCAVAAGQDGVLVVSGGDDQTVRIWAVDSRAAGVPTSRRAWMEAVAVAPEDRWLATGSFDGTAELWTVDGTLIRTLGRHRGGIRGVAVAPDGTWLATSDDHGPARVWSEHGKLLDTLEASLNEVSVRGIYTAAVRAIVIEPDGTWLASGREDGLIQVWAAEDRTLLCTLDGNKSWVDTLSVSSDGRWLASGGEDETLRVWKTADWTLTHALDGHVGGIRSTAFAPGGVSLLAVGQEDGSVRIWDAENGTERRTLVAHDGRVRTLAFSPTGQWLASGSSEGMIRIWSLAANDAESTTAIRVDDTVSACTWSKTKNVLYAVGSRGFYRFSLHPS